MGRFWGVDALASKYFSLSPFAHVANNPMRYTDNTGMWIDNYYTVEGVFLGSDGEGDDMRLVTEGAEEQVLSMLEDKASNRETLRSEEFSKVISTDPALENALQEVADLSLEQGVEHQIYILLDIYSDNPQITYRKGEVGTNDESKISGLVVDNGVRYDSETGYLFLGQAHGHPKHKTKTNLPNVSDLDLETSQEYNAPIYAIDAYSGSKGAKQAIHRANPHATSKKYQKSTYIGKTSSGFNLGKDALEIFSKQRIK